MTGHQLPRRLAAQPTCQWRLMLLKVSYDTARVRLSSVTVDDSESAISERP